ncbi:hypothetical protein NXA97_02420 [Acinetobacter baumannii]|uniref:hypothetical protein n=1 Tax=Acinetobacter baumannii TaxID=470 RepID=UPI00215B7B87|nr:hypothetical protein [Acinetobacter baumannii]MCR9032029.1 hypothetical protein [Acinetobacter baumannii]
MFVYFTDGTCINDSEIYGVKAKYEQNKYVVEVTIKPTHVLATAPSVQFKKEVFDDPNCIFLHKHTTHSYSYYTSHSCSCYTT